MERLFAGFRQVPIWVRIGVAGALTTYLAVASFTAMTLPPIGAADSPFHIESTYQMSQGRVPAAYGLEYQPIWVGSWYEDKREESRNIVASHPPLQYIIGAVLVGEALEQGNWQLAVAVMRTFNILVGAMVLLVLAWAGWKLGGQLRNHLAVALPSLAVLYVPFMRTAGDVYSEPLVVLFATIALTLTALILKNGSSTSYHGVLVLVCAFGMFTKATFVTTLLLVVFFVTVAYFIHRPGRQYIRCNLIRSAGFGGLVATATLVLTGWFYYRNQLASGSWFRSVEKHEYFGRPYRSLVDNLTGSEFYTVVPDSMFGIRSLAPILPSSKEFSLLLFGMLGIGVAYVAMRQFGRIYAAGLLSKQSLIVLSVVALFVLQMLGLYAQQLQHATGWGNINPRYFLTGLLPIGLYIAIGAVAFRPFRPYVTPTLMLAMSIVAVIYSVWFTGYSEEASLHSQVLQLASANGFSSPTIYVTYTLMATGALVVGLSLHKLNRVDGRS